jgi:predicted dehydrogenase
MFRAGVAGVGNLGKVHIQSLQKMAGPVVITALADPVPERRAGKNLKAETLNIDLDNQHAVSVGNIHSHADYSDLCTDDEVDVVLIAMPSDLHAPAAIMALEHGKHVFTEKPMALTAADCGRMIDAAKANDRTLMVGQVLRFWPAYMEAGRVMASGRYGRVLAATMRRYGTRPSGWFGEQARSGGVKLDLHIHDVDAALWWWGKPDEITSHTSGTTGGVTAVLSHWQYKTGLAVHLEALWDIGTPFAADFRLVMEQATLEYNMCNGKGLLLTTREGTQPVEMKAPEASPYGEEVAYFLQCVKERAGVVRCPPEESALAVQYATL